MPERGGAQDIPRPPDWQPGARAPWADLDDRELRVDVDRVLRALRSAPAPRSLPEADADGGSAVLIPVFEEEGQAWMVLTRRAQHLRNHRGEVSFPGGRIEPGEAPVDAAKREALEEIGLDPSSVEVIAELDHLLTVRGNKAIMPFVGILPGRPSALVANPDEVELVLTLPFSDLLAEGTYREERWTMAGREMQIPFFEVVGDTIWGATGRILQQFLSTVVATP